MKMLVLATGLLAIPAVAHAQSSPQDFVAMAASGGLYEIESSRMVLEVDDLDPEVREFAEQMIADHTEAGEQLAAAAERSGLTVPSEPASRDATKLQQFEAAEDKEALYLTQQNTGHDASVVLHRSYIAAGSDANLRSYAETVLPVLEEHEQHIETLAAR